MTRDVVFGLWAAAAAGLVCCELSARWTRPGHRGPVVATAAELLSRASASTWRLVGLFVVWMWLGWHLFAR